MRQCASHGTTWPEAVRSRVEPCFEDRLQDLFHRRLYHSILHGGNAQRPESPWFTNFRNEHSPYRTRAKRPVPKLLAKLG